MPFNQALLRFAAAAGLVLGLSLPAQAQTATLNNVTRPIFACMQRNNSSPEGRVTYSGGDSGRLRVFAVGGLQVGELNYRFDASKSTLTLTYVRGPAPFNRVRDGMNGTATRCRDASAQ